jgi:hypothetical protein
VEVGSLEVEDVDVGPEHGYVEDVDVGPEHGYVEDVVTSLNSGSV